MCLCLCLVGKRRKEYFGGVYTFYPAHHWRENVAFPNWEENERKERRLMGIYQKLIEKPITLSFFLYILETNNLTQNVKNQKYSFFKLQESIAFT